MVEMHSCEPFFDRVLPTDKPVHRRVDLVGGCVGDAQVHPEGGVGPPEGGGQLRGWPPPGRGAVQSSDPQPAGRAEQCGQPHRCAIAHTAATCPCGTLAVVAAGTSVCHFNPASNQSITWAGGVDRFATVSLRTRATSRKVRRRSADS